MHATHMVAFVAFCWLDDDDGSCCSNQSSKVSVMSVELGRG